MDVKRIFGCGINSQIIDSKFKELAEDNQHRLERVARRMGLSLRLRYELALHRNPFSSPHEEFLINHVELPSLEIYLLVTCLDTLAGQPRYVDFRDWIKRRPSFGQVGLREISDMFSDYLEEHGVGRNIRKLFKNLPSCLKGWLAQNVSIRMADDPLNAAEQDPEVLVERLCTYFFDVRRNDYTHSSISRQASIADDIFLPQEDGWWVTPATGTHFVLDRRKPKERWNFSYRQGMDEATILRLVIHSAVMQMLGIEVTQELVLLNFKNYSRMDALYSFLSEVGHNANLLKSWQEIGDSRATEFASYLIFVGVPTLSKEASSRMIDRYDLKYPLEQGFRQMTVQYLNEVRQLNSIINGFNQDHPRLKSAKGDIDGRWQIVRAFVSEQTNLPVFKSLLGWPARTEMTNLWLIIRDPCYS